MVDDQNNDQNNDQNSHQNNDQNNTAPDDIDQKDIKKLRRRVQRVAAGRRLDTMALGLAAAIALSIIVLGAVALANERVANSLSNDPLPLYVAAILASIAVLCSAFALICRRTKKGIRKEVAALITGGASFIFALVFIVASLADPPGGRGHPTISGLTVSGDHPTTLSFTIKADRIQADSDVSVVVRSSTQAAVLSPPPSADPIYAGVLQPDGEGAVDQQVSVEFVQGPAKYVSIFASAQGADCPDVCTADLAKEAACSTVQLPPDP